MADRFPLIANSSANQIQELAAADQLNLTGSNLIFGDSSDGSSDDVLSFGASGDLKIFHQADQSRIVESGPSVLKIMDQMSVYQILEIQQIIYNVMMVIM